MSSDEDSDTNTSHTNVVDERARQNLWFLREMGSIPDDDDEEDYRETLAKLYEEEDLDPDSANSLGGSSLKSDDEQKDEPEGKEKPKETPAMMDDMMDGDGGRPTQKSHPSPKTASKFPKSASKSRKTANKSPAEARDPPETGDEPPKTGREIAADGTLVVGPEEAQALEDWIISEGINEPLSDIPEYNLLLSLASNVEKNHDILMKLLTPNTMIDDSECEGDEQPMSEDSSTKVDTEENPETATEVENEENPQTESEEEAPEMIIEITDDDSTDGNDEWPEDPATEGDAVEIMEILKLVDDDDELLSTSTEVVEDPDLNGNDECSEEPPTENIENDDDDDESTSREVVEDLDLNGNDEKKYRIGEIEYTLDELIFIKVKMEDLHKHVDDALLFGGVAEEDLHLYRDDEIIRLEEVKLEDPSEYDVPQNELPEHTSTVPLSPRVDLAGEAIRPMAVPPAPKINLSMEAKPVACAPEIRTNVVPCAPRVHRAKSKPGTSSISKLALKPETPRPGGTRPIGIQIDDDKPSTSKEAMKALALANASREAMKALPIVHKPKDLKVLPPLPGAVPSPPETEDVHRLRVWAQLVSNIIDKQIQYIKTKVWNEKITGISEDKPSDLGTASTAIIDPDLLINMKEESELLSSKWFQQFGPESLKNLHRKVSTNAVQSILDERVAYIRIMRRPTKRQVFDIKLMYSKIFCTVEIDHKLTLHELARRIERSTFKLGIDVIQKLYDTVHLTWIWADGTVMIINATSQASLVDIQMDLLPKLVNSSIKSPPKINYLRLASHTSYPWAIDLVKFCKAETLTGPCFPEHYVFYVTKELPGVVARLHKSGEVQVFAMATINADAMITKLYYIAAKYRVKKDARSF